MPTPALVDGAIADASVDRACVIDGIDSEAVRSVGSTLCSAQGASSSEMAIGVACCMREGRSRGVWRRPTTALAVGAIGAAPVGRTCEFGVIDSETLRSAESARDSGRDMPRDSRESRSGGVATPKRLVVSARYARAASGGVDPRASGRRDSRRECRPRVCD